MRDIEKLVEVVENQNKILELMLGKIKNLDSFGIFSHSSCVCENLLDQNSKMLKELGVDYSDDINDLESEDSIHPFQLLETDDVSLLDVVEDDDLIEAGFKFVDIGGETYGVLTELLSSDIGHFKFYCVVQSGELITLGIRDLDKHIDYDYNAVKSLNTPNEDYSYELKLKLNHILVDLSNNKHIIYYKYRGLFPVPE